MPPISPSNAPETEATGGCQIYAYDQAGGDERTYPLATPGFLPCSAEAGMLRGSCVSLAREGKRMGFAGRSHFIKLLSKESQRVHN